MKTGGLQRQAGTTAPAQGFTLTELLVVLAILAVLTAFMLPALVRNGTQNKAAVCMNNLRQIYNGMMVYATDNRDTFHNFNGSIPNDGQWTLNPSSTNILTPNDGHAYWGVAYYTYAGTPRECFRCPTAKLVDEWHDDGRYYPNEFWMTSTYGLCRFLITPYNAAASSDSGPLKTTSFLSPSTVIVAQDSAEANMEGADDSLGVFPGTTRILTQWIGSGAPSNYGGMSSLYDGYHFDGEWYRHDRKNQTVWLSGQVSKIPFTGYNVGIDYRYYTGEKPVMPIPGN